MLNSLNSFLIIPTPGVGMISIFARSSISIFADIAASFAARWNATPRSISDVRALHAK